MCVPFHPIPRPPSTNAHTHTAPERGCKGPDSRVGEVNRVKQKIDETHLYSATQRPKGMRRYEDVSSSVSDWCQSRAIHIRSYIRCRPVSSRMVGGIFFSSPRGLPKDKDDLTWKPQGTPRMTLDYGVGAQYHFPKGRKGRFCACLLSSHKLREGRGENRTMWNKLNQKWICR
jgi:hypothetical protein